MLYPEPYIRPSAGWQCVGLLVVLASGLVTLGAVWLAAGVVAGWLS